MERTPPPTPVGPDVVPVKDEPFDPELRKRIGALLAEGAIVALPTETVYGLGVRGDSADAVERLRALKGRGTDSPLTWHVGEREALALLPVLRPLVGRLVARYWPGPLTLVLPFVPPGLEHVASAGWIGVRFPAHKGTADLLRSLDFPVVLTSANRHREPPATEAAQVASLFAGGVELILDGGPSTLREASGVLKLGPGTFELLREGLLPVNDLRATAGRRIAFVCTGNTCRSPMAEGFAKQLLAQRLGCRGSGPIARGLAEFGFVVRSMGVFAGAGGPPSEHAVTAMREQEIDITGHRSHPALPEIVRGSNEVYCMTTGHLDALRQSIPPGADANLHLLDPEGRDIPDPIGGPLEEYRRCAAAIRRAVQARAAAWA